MTRSECLVSREDIAVRAPDRPLLCYIARQW